MLIAASSSADDQLEWVGLVESKIRHLILALERNDHITLAHINPEQFDQQVQPEKYAQLICSSFHPSGVQDRFRGSNSVMLEPILIYYFFLFRDAFSTMWFIGLVFKKTESLNIDLTFDIQSFTAQGNKTYIFRFW